MNSNYELALLGCIDAPRFIDHSVIVACQTYTQAVQACWDNRRVAGMTLRTVAEYIGAHPPHVTDYLKEGPQRRKLPADKIAAFELVCGNRAISQWLAYRSKLNFLEEVAGRLSA